MEGESDHTSQSEREIHIVSNDGADSTSYQGWTHKSKWMSTGSVCNWYGIVCDETETVVSLNLTANQLRGTLPMLELFQAFRETLKSFDISRNSIRGKLTLPSGVDGKPWVKLEQFYVNDNEISGKAPFEWFEMTSSSPLVGVNMARNLLSGIPVSGISNLEALKELYLSYNFIVGTIFSMTNLPSLRKCFAPPLATQLFWPISPSNLINSTSRDSTFE